MHKRGGVRRDQAVRPNQGFDLCESLPLDFDVLDDGFDDQVAVFQIRVGSGALQVRERLLAIGSRNLPLGDAVAQEPVDSAQSLLQHSIVHLEHRSLEAGGRGDLRDARAHQPTAQHTHRLDRHLQRLHDGGDALPTANARGR